MQTRSETGLPVAKRSDSSRATLSPLPGPLVSPSRAKTTSRAADRRESESDQKLAEIPQPGKGARLSFSLKQIRSVALRCDHCRTVIRFPRIRWTGSPESCPNCGTSWTRPPSCQDPLSEDVATYAFRVLHAFREALQTLSGMNSGAVFTVSLETGRRGSKEKFQPAVAAPNGGRHG